MKDKRKKSSAAQAAPAEKSEFSLIPRQNLETLYANLLKGGMLEKRLRRGRLRRDDGWSAVKSAVAGVMLDLGDDDFVIAADELPLVRCLRGDKAGAVVGDRKGKRGDAARAQEAAQSLLQAVGAALASRTKKNGKVAAVFWRDAEAEVWGAALEMARVHTLPLILICPWVGTLGGGGKVERKKTDGLAPGTELPRIAVDGFDAVAVYRVAHEAIERARRDRGATMIECVGAQLKGQRGRGDAVVTMERYLRGKGMLRRGMKQEIEAGFERDLKGKTKPSAAIRRKA